jgi:hypothetical protein
MAVEQLQHAAWRPESADSLLEPVTVDRIDQPDTAGDEQGV